MMEEEKPRTMYSDSPAPVITPRFTDHRQKPLGLGQWRIRAQTLTVLDEVCEDQYGFNRPNVWTREKG